MFSKRLDFGVTTLVLLLVAALAPAQVTAPPAATAPAATRTATQAATAPRKVYSEEIQRRMGRILPEGVEALRNLEYATADGHSLKLDLYLPAKRSPDAKLPVIAWVHGGAWAKGSKNLCPAAWLVPEGYAAVSIEYRLTGVAPFPAQIHDCKAAIRWLKANASKYNLDPDRIAVWGASAGGHLVSLLGMTAGLPEMDGQVGDHLDQSTKVQAVANWCGVTELDSIMRMRANLPLWKKTDYWTPFFGSKDPSPAKIKAFSPVTYAKADNAPTLIVHGDKDNVVPLQQGQVLEQAIKSAGGQVTLVVVQGAEHGTAELFYATPIMAKMQQFFDEHLKQAKRD